MIHYITYVNVVKKCYCEYENGGKLHGAELGIICSTTSQWVREDVCKPAKAAGKGENEDDFGEFCTGPHNKSKAVRWENRNELCRPGTVNLSASLS